MKSILTVLLVAITAGFAGCGNAPDQSPPRVEETVGTTPEPAPTEPPLPDMVIDSRESAMEAVNHNDLRIRWRAVGWIKQQSGGAFDDLKQLLTSGHEDVVCAAVSALVETGSKEDVIPLLRDALNDPRVAVRTEAVIGLGSYGPDAAAALPDIEPLTRADDSRLREKAIEARDRITAP